MARPSSKQWVVADPFADEVDFGPTKLAFQRATMASMLEDFTNPPGDGGKTDGILSMHYAGRMYRIPVRENVGKKVAVGKSDIRVEITSYLPDARPDAAARFTSASKAAEQPAAGTESLSARQGSTAAADCLRQAPAVEPGRDPRLELSRSKFWYHHPAVTPPEAGMQFLQTPDGRLYYRVVADGKVLSHGEAKEGSRINTGGQLHLSIVKYLAARSPDRSRSSPSRRPSDDAVASEVGGACQGAGRRKGHGGLAEAGRSRVRIPADCHPGRQPRHRFRLRAAPVGVFAEASSLFSTISIRA